MIARRNVMDNKDAFINELKEFNVHHDNRLRVMKNAVKGLVPQEEACVKLFDCPIHKWMAGRKPLLNKLYGSENIKVLEARHAEWHEQSDKICEILSSTNEKKGGLLGKVFGKKQEMNEGELDKAMSYVADLKELTDTIDSTFGRMIKRANAIQNDMFEKNE
jgi:hypothetical protein